MFTLNITITQRRSQDFCLGGRHPADVTRYILCDLQKPTTFGGGWGYSSRNCPWYPEAEQIRWKFSVISISGSRSLGGGGEWKNFFPVAPGKEVKNNQIPSIPGNFVHFRFEERNNINSLQKKHLPKVWGGMAPWPP